MKIPIVIIVSRIEKDLFIFKQNPKEQSSATIFSKVVSLCQIYTFCPLFFSCTSHCMSFPYNCTCKENHWLTKWCEFFFVIYDYLFYIFTKTKEDIVKSYIIISSFPGKIK